MKRKKTDQHRSDQCKSVFFRFIRVLFSTELKKAASFETAFYIFIPFLPFRGLGFILILFRSKHSVSCGLSLCGLTILYGHWQIPYVYENHVRFYDDACVVGMYVSLFVFFTNPVILFRFMPAVTIPLLVKGRQR